MQVNIDKETVEPNWHIAQNKVAQLFKQTFQCCRQPNTFSGNLTWCWLAERNNRSLRAHMVEQIDGVIELDGELNLVEIKWWSVPLGAGEVSHHLVRVFNRGHLRGIFISASARSRFRGETFERLYQNWKYRQVSSGSKGM